MGYHKGHKEFHVLDMDEGWHTLPGYPAGIQERLSLANLMKEQARQPFAAAAFCAGHVYDRSVRSRLLGGGFPTLR
jgi:hypothetical protein